MTDTEPAQTPDLGTASCEIAQVEIAARQMRERAKWLRKFPQYEGTADVVDGAAYAIERALSQLCHDLKDVLYDCERVPRIVRD